MTALARKEGSHKSYLSSLNEVVYSDSTASNHHTDCHIKFAYSADAENKVLCVLIDEGILSYYSMLLETNLNPTELDKTLVNLIASKKISELELFSKNPTERFFEINKTE